MEEPNSYVNLFGNPAMQRLTSTLIGNKFSPSDETKKEEEASNGPSPFLGSLQTSPQAGINLLSNETSKKQ